jgi:hypothetical protein
MFQHRHYAAIADVLADMREAAPRYATGDYTPEEAVTWFETELCRLFARDNYGFKPDRFRKAARRAPDMHGKDKVA